MRQDLVSLLWMLLSAVFGLMVAIGVVSWIRTRRRNRDLREMQEHAGNPLRCKVCGYIVEKLDVPRCPECGAAIGFRKSFQALGVSDVELAAYQNQNKSGNRTGQ